MKALPLPSPTAMGDCSLSGATPLLSHTAYIPCPLLKLPLNIECILAYDDYLLVGTKQGHLLMYHVFPSPVRNGHTHGSALAVHGSPPLQSPPNGALRSVPSPDNGLTHPDPGWTVQLMRTNKFFSKKSIVQLAAVPEYSILVALADGIISVHDLDLAVTNFPAICSVSRTKGASAFTLSLVKSQSLTGETAVAVRVAVAVRKKVQFYYWKNRKFHELYPDVSLTDVPKTLAWVRDSVCLGFKSEYKLIKMNEKQKVVHLFPTGKNQEPRITVINEDEFGLGQDDRTSFIDCQGQLKLNSVGWSQVPQSVAPDEPFILGVVGNQVEVKAHRPGLSIQTLELPKPKVICSSDAGHVYVASASQIWRLRMVPVSTQIPQLLREKQFELAITLSNIGDENVDDQTRRVQQIQTLYAFDLFCAKKFEESLEVFYKLNTDASHVVGLFPDLLPQEFRNRLSYPAKLPTLPPRDYETGVKALVEYLTKVRHHLNGLTVKSVSPLPIKENVVTISSKRQMLQIIDTTLVKCYLKLNNSLVSSLLRLSENQCHLEETERALIKNEKYNDLVILYKTRGLHKKALALLKEHSQNRDSPLYGHQQTVAYLQELGPDHLRVIFEYASWVLEENEADGLSIFTEDLSEVESLPRGNVLDFLSRRKRSTVIPYLRHIILEWKETNTIFHNSLILNYKDQIMSAWSEKNLSRVEQLRSELQEFLRTSKHYTGEIVLPVFPKNCLDEERAILLGSLSKHRAALTMYLYRIKDVAKAKDYCQKAFIPGSQVYSVLIELLLRPPDTTLLRELCIDQDSLQSVPKGLEHCLEVLQNHGDKVDCPTVLRAIPDHVPLERLGRFLSASVEMRISQKRHNQVLHGLTHADHLQLQERRVLNESNMLIVSDHDVCRVCHKRFKNQGAIVRFPSGHVVHYSCQDKGALL